MKVIEEARYICVDLERNNNKFWTIALREDHSAVTEWGRVGESGSRKEFLLGDALQARLFFEGKRREKESKGYSPLRTLGSTDANRSARLAEAALEQIGGSCAETQRLVARLARANVHRILEQTSLEYNEQSGAFSTPLGIVTRDALVEARALLLDISTAVDAQDYDDLLLSDAISRYLMLVPRDIGRSKPDPRRLFPDMVTIREQNALLDNLEASLATAIKPASPAVDDCLNFGAELRHVEDPVVIREIRTRFHRTAQRVHMSHALDVIRVFEVQIAGMRLEYERRARMVGNAQSLWHGSRIGNLLSILKSGFVIPPCNAPHVTGRMFGNGVYFWISPPSR